MDEMRSSTRRKIGLWLSLSSGRKRVENVFAGCEEADSFDAKVVYHDQSSLGSFRKEDCGVWTKCRRACFLSALLGGY